MRNAPARAMTLSSARTTSSLSSATHKITATRGRARQFWGVFDRSLVPMATVDNQRRYLAVNRAGRLLFRLSLAEMREHRLGDFTSPRTQQLLEGTWSRLQGEGAVHGHYELSFPDGSRLGIVYCALANALPGQHLVVFAPAGWPEDELGIIDAGLADDTPSPVSPRELEVLTLIAAGADLEQIADELSISINTVRTHVLNAYRKLGANNRAHAIALAMHQGLIELPPPTDRA